MLISSESWWETFLSMKYDLINYLILSVFVCVGLWLIYIIQYKTLNDLLGEFYEEI